MRMLCGLVLTLAVSGSAESWDRTKAFQYLETRQKQWAEWKPAQKPGGACISCHTGLSYLVARQVSGEPQHTVEIDLLEGVRRRLLEHPPEAMLHNPGVEAVLNLLALSFQRRDADAPLSKPEEVAMQRLWENQLRDGKSKGAWTWFQLELHPFESEHSAYFGAALAEKALASYPARAATGIAALRAYLKDAAQSEPLHNRLAWIAFSASGKAAKTEVLRDLWAAQSEDGGWSSEALGPWTKHAKAPADSGSNAYATAWAAFAAREAGAGCAEPGMKKALNWLQRNQDRETGAWKSVSMNKVFPEGSMQRGFMTDTATGFAAAVLLRCEPERKSVAARERLTP